jgi:Rps23 Pro-64 3,4-dihydroxylase Tpa1-like proline 4-hydroxylase
MLYISFLSQEEKEQKKDFKINLVKRVYITDILNINIEKADKDRIIKILDTIHEQFAEILKNRIAIDDNKDFLRISMENRIHFIENSKISTYKAMEDDEIIKKITGEDIIWFR